ncbi:MAG: restriction endonuclease subunit S [Methanosarcinales archaeon]|nr:restriction endonuclease subunit S [Methanosarcinales archaeon]
MSAVKGWKRESLGAQLKLIRNGYSGQQVNQFTNFPVSRIETISDGTIDLNKVGYVDFIPDSYLLQSGDILFSNINSLKHIGKVAQVSEGTKLFHGMNLLVLRPVEEVDKKFLFYKLINAKLWFEKVAAQAINQASINQGTIKELRIELPQQKPEQTKIAEILSTVDRAIEQTEALIAKQQRIKTGLMQDLLTRGIDKHGNLRSEQTHEFKDSPLGRIPVEWDVKILREVSCGGAQNGFFKKPELVGFGYKLINVSEIYQPLGIDTGHHKVERVRAKVNDLLKYGVKFGDVFFTRSSLVLEGIAHCNIIRDIKEPTLFECHVMRIQPKKDEILPEFLTLFCQSHIARIFLMSRAKHVTMTTISQPELEELIVPVPQQIEEQSKIVDSVLSCEQVIRHSERERQKLRSLKTALMQDLLTGKKRVIPLLTEPQEAGA